MVEDAEERVFSNTSSDGTVEFSSEGHLNDEGFFYLEQDNEATALATFQRNASYYPKSFRTYDSLGRAHMQNGNRWLAIENRLHSLEQNPRDRNALRMLEQLGAR